MHPFHAGLALAVLLASAACDDDDDNNSESFNATMTGAAERPTPVVTTATGAATFTARNDTILFTITVSGLSGVATMAHIHAPADTGQAIPPAHTFTIVATAAGTLATGTFVLPSNATMSQDSLLTLMRNGNAYVNVHTVLNPNGEVRGQIRLQ